VRAALDSLIRMLGQFDDGESTVVPGESAIRTISR